MSLGGYAIIEGKMSTDKEKKEFAIGDIVIMHSFQHPDNVYRNGRIGIIVKDESYIFRILIGTQIINISRYGSFAYMSKL